MKKVMLIYPPGEKFQRGEERCQANVEASTSTAVRACNDLGYCSAELKKAGHKVFLRDYQTEGASREDLETDFNEFNPDVVFISTTNATIFDDIETINILKGKKQECVFILKGAMFFDIRKELLRKLPLENVDIIIGGEPEFIIADLIDSYFGNESLEHINGIFYKDKKWNKTKFTEFECDLDKLEFPDRDAMKNELYTRPDTNEPMATIVTSRGCPASCIYCLTPFVSGKKVRRRSPGNIVNEIKECYEKHGIKNFFFRSDTFTLEREWVEKICDKIITEGLHKKISWVANSRTKPIEKSTLEIMKMAGCWLIAFGIESGSPETLEKIKKYTTVEDNKKAVRLAENAGLKTFGFYMIGFPWEHSKHLQETKRHMFELNTDFVEMHLAIPYTGTELYDIAKENGLISRPAWGMDYFSSPAVATKYLSREFIEKFRKRALLRYHLRPEYVYTRAFEAIKEPSKFKGYASHGIRLLKNFF
ncbi:MAG: B12-binding domain-containing radical SAM protein [Candidatus Nanoarchaeia archaeon]